MDSPETNPVNFRSVNCDIDYHRVILCRITTVNRYTRLLISYNVILNSQDLLAIKPKTTNLPTNLILKTKIISFFLVRIEVFTKICIR